jgi:hypothetical protein
MIFIEVARVSATLGQHKVDRSILDLIDRRRKKVTRSTLDAIDRLREKIARLT